MERIAVRLPKDLEAALGRVAGGVVRELPWDSERPGPGLPPFSNGDPTLAEKFEEELTGFGER